LIGKRVVPLFIFFGGILSHANNNENPFEECSSFLSKLPRTQEAMRDLRELSSQFKIRLLVREDSSKVSAVILIADNHAKLSRNIQNVVGHYRDRAVEYPDKMLNAILVVQGRKQLDDLAEIVRPGWFDLFGAKMNSVVFGILNSRPTLWSAVTFGEDRRIFAIDKARDEKPEPTRALLQLSLMAAGLVGERFASHHHLIPAQLHAGVLALVYGLTAWVGADELFGKYLKKYEHSSWYKHIFPLTYGLGTIRDEGMASNLQDIFSQNPDISELLTVVGTDHVNPITEIMAAMGWEFIDLEDLLSKN